MYFADHVPPHFHAEYAEHEARIAIESLTVLSGTLPPRAMGLVAEWSVLQRHRDALAATPAACMPWNCREALAAVTTASQSNATRALRRLAGKTRLLEADLTEPMTAGSAVLHLSTPYRQTT